MTDNLKHIDLDSEDFEEAPKALRDYARNLKKQLEQAAQERDDARKTLASKAVADVLSDKGFKAPKRVERDLLADGIDPLDKSAVDAWLEANGDDYARGAEGSASQPPVPEKTDEEKALQKNYEQLVAGDQLRAAADMTKWQLAQSEITQDMNGAAVAAVYAKYGI